MNIGFIDFQKAFDKINHNSVWNALQKRSVPVKIINLIKTIYKSCKCKILHQGRLSDPFEIKNGVRQGCVLSPLLFLLVVDDIMETLEKESPRGIQWGINKQLTDTDIDDICILTHSSEDLQEKLSILNREGKKRGLKISTKETEVMKVYNNIHNSQFKIRNDILKQTTKFCYLTSLNKLLNSAIWDL
jgi:hypothetical protein